MIVTFQRWFRKWATVLIVGPIIEYLNEKLQLRKPIEVKFMYIVKDNQVAVPFQVTVGEVLDAEGHPVDGGALAISVASDNADAVAVEDNGDGSGVISFGAPGLANVTATVKIGDTVLAAGSASFTVTAGDPASIASVKLTFDGLTEAP